MTFPKALFFLLFIPLLMSAEPMFWRCVYKINKDQDNYFRQKYHLSPCMDGGGGIETVDEIGHGYAAPYPADLKLARRIAVDIITRFLQAVNSNTQLRHHLKEHPFPIERLYITLTFPENPQLSQKQISYVSLIKGQIFYNYDTHGWRGYQTLHKETFVEASNLLSSNEPKDDSKCYE